MKKNTNSKQMLFEMMKKVNSDFIIKEEYFVEEQKSSYSQEMINDINVLLGTRTSLSPKDIQTLADSYSVSPEEVQQTLDYVLQTRKETQAEIPASSQEAEEINDIFKYWKEKAPKGSYQTAQYAGVWDRYLAKPKQNPMVGRFLKLTEYLFRWEMTYKDYVDRINPEWEIQQRKGQYTEVPGFNAVKFDRSGQEEVSVVPESSFSIVLVLDENGNMVEALKSREVKEKYSEYFQPSFLSKEKPVTSGSGVPFRGLKLKQIKRFAGAGRTWNNPAFKFEKYSQYFNLIDKTSKAEPEDISEREEI
jgi:hypothetical protein